MAVRNTIVVFAALGCLAAKADFTIKTAGLTDEEPRILVVSDEEGAAIMADVAAMREILLKVEARIAAYNRFQSAMELEDVPFFALPIKTQMKVGGEVLSFDEDGSLWCDPRFLLPEEREVKARLERLGSRVGGQVREKPDLAADSRPEETGRDTVLESAPAAPVRKLPVFCGFEDRRYQQHDALIMRLVDEFNADRAAWADATAEQAATIHDLRPALVKAMLIEETGGRGPKSTAAWKVDPMQVNVPGDWDPVKRQVGLWRPQRRNEGSVEDNIRAGIKYLVRKGFGPSGAPAKSRPDKKFDGWGAALRRYNGRNERMASGRRYKDAYAERILKRAESPKAFIPISRGSGQRSNAK